MLTEKDELDITLFSLIKEGFKTSGSIREKLDMQSNLRFNTLITELPEKYVSKAKEQGQLQNVLTLTKKGRDFLTKNKKDAVDYKIIPDHCANWIKKTKNRKALPQAKTSQRALNAVAGISELINDNDRLVQHIKWIHNQTGEFLASFNDSSEDQQQ